MTDTVEMAVPGPEALGDAPSEELEPTLRTRVLLALCAVAAVIPFFWAAIRDARNGFYPTMDVASTVIQARATFSSHPPLVGMWSSGSSWAGHEIHFPGPILLYWLAAPTHLLGNTWGPLLAMAVLNAFWVLLIGWLVYRLVGVHAALGTFLFLNAFIWSIGSENLIDPRPMQMVTIPFFCYLFATWLVAAGKIDALPVWALIGNFLFLDHLVQALQIPVIGLCALVGVVLWVTRTRSAHRAGDLDDAAYAAETRRFRKRLIQTGGITFLMWLPSLIQQVTTSPGNLELLAKSMGKDRTPVGSYVAGYNFIARLTAKPPFWFRGGFDNWTLRQDIEFFSIGDVIAGVVLVVVVAVAVVVARRHGDRLGVAALMVSIVGIVVSIETVFQAPASLGFPVPYLRSIWGLAAFIWFAVLFSVWRLLKPRPQRRVATLAGVGAVVLGLLATSYADYGSATDLGRSRAARQLADEVVPLFVDRGTVKVKAGPGVGSLRFHSAVILALDSAGVPWCVDRHFAYQYGLEHYCASGADVGLVVTLGPRGSDLDGKLLLRVKGMSTEKYRELAAKRRITEEWLKSRRKIEITPAARESLARLPRAEQKKILASLAPADGDLSGLIDSDLFTMLVGLEVGHRNNPSAVHVGFADETVPIEAIARYLELTEAAAKQQVWVHELPRSALH